MEVKEIKELPNGGAEIFLAITAQEVGILLSDSIFRAIKRAVEEEEKRTEELGNG